MEMETGKQHRNEVLIRGLVGEWIRVSKERGEPSTFSVKTTRMITTTDGDTFSKFDWHFVQCISSRIVNKLRSSMTVEVEGAISTVRSKATIIASSIKIVNTGDEWSLREGIITDEFEEGILGTVGGQPT